MTSVLDFAADRNGVELARMAREYDLPDYVKQAGVVNLRDASAVPPTAYADLARRRFPCHTKAAAFLSALYFYDKAAEFDPKFRAPVEQQLEHFAGFWGISDDVAAVRKQAAALRVKAAELPESAYALPKTRELPLTGPAEVKAAAEALYGRRDRLPWAERQEAAERITEKAAALGVALPGPVDEYLEKQAGRGVCSPSEVVTLVRNRSYAARVSDTKAELVKLAAAIDKDRRRFCNPDNLVKLAAVLDGVDEVIGLKGHYSELLPRPEDVLFAVPYTKAAAVMADRVELVTGSSYSKEALAKVALDDVRSLFGDEIADAVRSGYDVDPEKLAEVATTLPRGDAELFEGLMQECGLHASPVKSASQVPVGFSDEDLERWADELTS